MAKRLTRDVRNKKLRVFVQVLQIILTLILPLYD